MLHHLELYCGIGGMRLGVRAALPPNIQYSVSSVDINRVANHVYQHNFDDAPRTVSIEHCSCDDLDIAPRQQHDGHEQQQPSYLLWTLSPPCQPYTMTSNSKQQDIRDERATSFSHLLRLLPQLQTPPTHVLLENVPAFYGSQSYQRWHDVLLDMGYQTFDVALCPSQLGLPHRRPRHYTLARLVRGRLVNSFSASAVSQLEQLAHENSSGTSHQELLLGGQHIQQLQPYLELDWSQYSQPLQQCPTEIQQQVQRHTLPLSRVAKYYKVLDIVTPQSTHSNCFTKGYQKNILGCGSYLLETAAAEQLCEQDSRGRWHLTRDPYAAARTGGTALNSGTVSTHIASSPAAAAAGDCQGLLASVPPALCVRAFTPREVANLQGFPQCFSFPADVTDRQAYALLGNSVSIDAVTFLASVLLQDVVAV
eukprot:GHUV01005228.1.p1 GENE.GHUV01005228.1~~GHUV01005228.1.p1  ORF type:complete len:423 (+),score=110.30 GHUV01005228.1:702-1970(+)